MYSVSNSSTFFVSPSQGNDSKNGLSATSDRFNAPFRTLERAVSAVNDLRNVGDMRPITVVLTEDIYLKAPINISVGGITVDGRGHKICGGFKIDGWTSDIFNGSPCYSATVPDNNTDFTDLWVDSKRADMTRFPKEGYLKALDTENNEGERFDIGSKWFIADTKDIEKVNGIENAIINYYHFWIDEHSPVESYDPISGKLTMAYRSRFRINTNFDSAAAMRYYITNVPSTFDSENEWYLDKSAKKVYYAASRPPKEAYAPSLTYLFKICADNVRIQNAELFCTKGDYASRSGQNEGEIYASDIQSVCWAPGALIFERAKNCTVENCHIHSIGIHALEIKCACKAIRIENNKICDLGAGGIKIFGGSAEEDPSLATTDCKIISNEIAHCGKRYAAGCGILANHTSYLEISDNHIHHTDYSGISVGWVWGYKASSTHSNLIRRNHIHHIGMGKLSDMGGIYLLGNQPGTAVSENRIHDVTSANYGGWGIYTDEGSGNITIEKNVVFRTKDSSFHQHYGYNNVVRNNIFAFGNGSVRISRNEFHNTALFENNIYLCNGHPAYFDMPGTVSVSARNNIFFDISGKALANASFTLSEWKELAGKDAGSIEADPMFTNAKEDDFTIDENSPAVKLGFVALKGFLANGKE